MDHEDIVPYKHPDDLTVTIEPDVRISDGALGQYLNEARRAGVGRVLVRFAENIEESQET